MDFNSNPMVEFFRRLSHDVVKTPSAWWYDVQPKVFLSLPYYKTIDPPESEIQNLFREHKLRAIRYPTPMSSYGFVSNITINTKKDYDFVDLHQKARNQTKRGLENCEVREIDFDYLEKYGMRLNEDTANRQGRQSQFCDSEYWKKYCQAAEGVDGVSAWGAFVERELASFLISIRTEGNWQEWVVNHSSTRLRNKSPNNALAFTVAQHFFRNEDCEGICYGLGSLEETADLDHFKGRMGWEIKPIKQRLIFAKKIELACWLVRDPCLWLLGKVFPRNYKVRKTLAMIHLYQQQTFDVSETVIQ